MNGEWIQAASETWHLIWPQDDLAEGQIGTWCNKVFKFDDPQLPGKELGYEHVLHDECVRKSEEL